MSMSVCVYLFVCASVSLSSIFMAALCNRAGHYIFALWFLLSSIFFLFPRLISYFYSWCGLSVNFRCRSETCCTRLTKSTGRKKSSKIRHLGTVAQLCRAISSQLRQVSTIRKKLVRQQYLPHMSSQYGELRPTSG